MFVLATVYSPAKQENAIVDLTIQPQLCTVQKRGSFIPNNNI